MDEYFQTKQEPGRSGCKKAVDLVYQLTLDVLKTINGGDGAKIQDIACFIKKNYRLNLDEIELETNVQNGVQLGLFQKVICKTVNGLYKLAESVKPKEPECVCKKPKKSKCPNPRGKQKPSKPKKATTKICKCDEEPEESQEGSSDSESSISCGGDSCNGSD